MFGEVIICETSLKQLAFVEIQQLLYTEVCLVCASEKYMLCDGRPRQMSCVLLACLVNRQEVASYGTEHVHS